MAGKSTRIFLCTFLLGAVVSCKSWGKFWYNYTPGQATALYAGAGLWNDYITADGSALTVRGVSPNAPSGTSNRLNASGTTCNTAATGGYGVCIHAGMMRQAVVNDKEDCSGMTVTDALGAFIWVCDASVKPVRVISVGFNEGKYMTDLVDFDAVVFRPNSLKVSVDGSEYAGPSSVWWANPVTNLSTTTYGAASAVVLVQTNPNSGATLTPSADKIALLVRPGVKITYAGSGAVVNNSARNFSWYEGTIDKNGSLASALGLALTNGSFVVVQNFGIVNASATGNSAFQFNARNSFFRDIRYANGGIAAEKSLDFAAGGDANLISGVFTSNDTTPLYLNSSNNVVLQLTIANTGGVFDIQGSAISNFFLNMTMANNSSGGIGALRFNINGAVHNTWMNLGAGSSPSPAMHLGTGVPVNMHSQFINLAAYVNSATLINSSASSYTYIGGIVSFGNSSSPLCGSASNVGFSGTCTAQNSSDFTLVSSALDPTNSYVGKILTDDSANASDAGAAATNIAAISDWLKFANGLRGYGLDAAVFPAAGNQGRCTAANCRIWDWSLKATDSQYRNLLPVPTGNMTAGHKWNAATQPQCTQPGAQWIAASTCDKPPFPGNSTTCSAAGGTLTASACLTTFLRNAYEIIGDGIGNENGLCESNEACIYTPNIASYQGHGNLTCIRGPAEYGCASAFVDGTVSGVVLYQYTTNGY